MPFMLYEAQGLLPGQNAALETPQVGDITFGPWEYNRSFVVGALLDPAARDLGSDPTTLLRAGLFMGVVTATKLASTMVIGAVDGTGTFFGVLLDTIHVTEDTRFCRLLVSGNFKAEALIEGIAGSTPGSWATDTNNEAIRGLLAPRRAVLSDQFFQ